MSLTCTANPRRLSRQIEGMRPPNTQRTAVGIEAVVEAVESESQAFSRNSNVGMRSVVVSCSGIDWLGQFATREKDSESYGWRSCSRADVWIKRVVEP